MNAKKQPWWKNTLLVIVADHGIRFPPTGRMIDDFKLPMLWLGGAVEKHKGRVVETICSQTDIAATLLKQLNRDASPFLFSRDITDSTLIPFAFFSNSVGFSIVQPDRYFIYDTKGRQIREQQGSCFENEFHDRQQ